MKRFENEQLSISKLIADVEIIIGYSSMLLQRLEARVTQWSPSTALGDVFLQITDFMRVFNQYVQHYDYFRCQLSNFLAEKHSKSLSKFLKVSFFSLILLPSQLLNLCVRKPRRHK